MSAARGFNHVGEAPVTEKHCASRKEYIFAKYGGKLD